MCFLNNICVMDSLDGVRSSSHLYGFHEEEMTPSGGCGGLPIIHEWSGGGTETEDHQGSGELWPSLTVREWSCSSGSEGPTSEMVIPRAGVLGVNGLG